VTSKLIVQPSLVELEGRNGSRHEFTGALLGSGSSRSEHHSDHRGESAQRGTKCSACRWFEVAIYRREPNRHNRGVADYVVHTVGNTTVHGERRLSRIKYTRSAFDVLELLTVRPVDRDPFIAAQSARALAQAAQLDEDIRDAYINRAVV